MDRIVSQNKIAQLVEGVPVLTPPARKLARQGALHARVIDVNRHDPASAGGKKERLAEKQSATVPEAFLRHRQSGPDL